MSAAQSLARPDCADPVDPDDPVIVCEHLHKAFAHTVAVADVSFAVARGEIFALLGSNGAGKTTIIKMLLGLLPLGGGSIRLAEGIGIGYSPETPAFPPALTAREVLRYYARLQRMPKQQIPAEIQRVLELTGLDDSRTTVKHYSKGMLQRLAVAQVLLGSPQLLILDEPTAGLDALGRVEMMALLLRLKDSGTTILLNSHILGDVERVCDRALILRAGQVVTGWQADDPQAGALERVFVEAMREA